MDHFSITQAMMYARCPKQYEFRYYQKIICPPGIALLVGSGVHKGAETALRSKIETGKDLKPDSVRDSAVAGFDERIENDGVLLSKEEEGEGRAAVVGRSRDRVAALAHFWAVTGQGEYQPVGAEVEFTLPTEREIGLPLVGIIDAVEAGRVTDLKTGTKALSQRDCDTSLQLTAYSLHVHRVQGKAPEVRLDQLLDRKGGTERVVLSSRRTRADYERLVARLRATVEAILAGSFPPTDPTNWWCSERWCGFSAACPYYIPELESKKAEAADAV